jgi:hypothetical protein
MGFIVASANVRLCMLNYRIHVGHLAQLTLTGTMSAFCMRSLQTSVRARKGKSGTQSDQNLSADNTDVKQAKQEFQTYL